MSKDKILAKHNFDLTKLSASQLATLVDDARVACREKQKTECAEALKKLKDSGQFKSLKEELKTLKKECEVLEKGFKFTLNVPIEFTVEFQSDLDYSFGVSAFDNSIFETDVSGCISKDHNLSRKQFTFMNPTVKDYVSDACEDIQNIVPPELFQPKEQFEKKFVEFCKRVEKLGLTLDELS
jgi:hypothetical protein